MGAITATQLSQLFPNADNGYLAQVANELNTDLPAYGLDSGLRQAHFFAQVMQEAGPGLEAQVESLNYSPNALETQFSTTGTIRTKPCKTATRKDPATGKIIRPANQATSATKLMATGMAMETLPAGMVICFAAVDSFRLPSAVITQRSMRNIKRLYGADDVRFCRESRSGREFSRIAFARLFASGCSMVTHACGPGSSDLNVDAITAVINKGTHSYGERRENFQKAISGLSASSAGLSVLIGVLFLSAWSSAQTAKPSGCLPDEGVLFSCRLKGNDRIVSLCSSPKTSPFASITYRYGTETRNELTYVASVENHNQFLGTVSPVSPNASVRQVWFELKDKKYIVTSCVGGDCAHRGGLIVFQGSHLLISQPCANAGSSQPWFSSGVVRFGSDLDSSHSNTDLIQLQDFDNGVEVLYPWKRVN